MRIKSAIVVIIFLSWGAHAADCENIKEMDVADTVASKIHDWADVNYFYSHFRQCDTGYIAEEISASVTRLLAHKWEALEQLKKITDKDNNFESWVLNHVDTTVNGDDLERIIQEAKDKCPGNGNKLCEKIKNATRQALQELKQ